VPVLLEMAKEVMHQLCGQVGYPHRRVHSKHTPLPSAKPWPENPPGQTGAGCLDFRRI
jgi:hypothetical protein